MEPKIHSTREFDKFNLSPKNRAVSYNHVQELIKAIKANNMLDVNPILVDDDFNIIAGQHRFLAAKHLNIPIYYIKKNDVPDEYYLKSNFLQKTTTQQTAIDYYLTTNEATHYRELERVKKEFGLPCGSAAMLLGESGHNHSRAVMRGEFRLESDEKVRNKRLQRYREVYDILHDKDFKYERVYKTLPFVRGLCKLIDAVDMNWPRFLLRLRTHWFMLDCAMPNSDYWVDRFLKVYNKRLQQRLDTDDLELDI